MPSFVLEMDDLRQEVRQNAPGTVSLFPKVAGVGNVVAAPNPTFTLHSPTGAQIGAGNATVTPLGPDGISRLDITVPAQATLDEGYQARVTWQQNGTGVDRTDIVSFDVVLWPLAPSVSLHDLLELRPDIGRALERMGTRFDPVRSAEQMAALFGYRATVELDARLRSQVAQDALRSTHASRPALILNRERLRRFEKPMAVALIFKANTPNPESEDNESAALYRAFQLEADSAWRSIGPLQYDHTEDLVPDAEDRNAGRVVRSRRVQG